MRIFLSIAFHLSRRKRAACEALHSLYFTRSIIDISLILRIVIYYPALAIRLNSMHSRVGPAC
jgi:hypothetical protein